MMLSNLVAGQGGEWYCARFHRTAPQITCEEKVFPEDGRVSPELSLKVLA